MSGELIERLDKWLSDFAVADLDEGAADAVTVGMVYQQEAERVWLPRLRAELSALRGEGWQSIESAPRDGTEFQARIPGDGEDNVIAWVGDLLDSRGEYCGAWAFTRDQEPPDDWTDGYCWEVNEDGNRSTEPTHWKPLPTPDAAVIARLVGTSMSEIAYQGRWELCIHFGQGDEAKERMRAASDAIRQTLTDTAAQRQSVSPRPRRNASPSEVKTGRQGIGEE